MVVDIRPMRHDDIDAVDRFWRGDAVPWAGAARTWGVAGKLPARLVVATDEGSSDIVGYASYIAVPLWREAYAPLRLP